VSKLAAETPSILIVFDLLQTPRGADLTARSLSGRRTALEAFFATLGDASSLRLSPATQKRAEAERWLKRAGGGELDGVVAKRLDEPYRPGERAMVKVKCLRTADCVVGGFRYATNGTQVGSLEPDSTSATPSARTAPKLDISTLTAQDGDTTLTATPIDGETGSGF